MKRLLILGGTGDAAELAIQAALLPNLQVISSLAGRTQTPMTPEGLVRVGGFGGASGLIRYLQEQQIDFLVDATHPFAAQMTENAAIAAGTYGIPYLILDRPAWKPIPGDLWLEVDTVEAAAALLEQQAQRVFLTIGRQQLSAFAGFTDLWFLMRMIDPPTLNTPIPPGELLLDRGPFSLKQERHLLQHYAIDTLVTKNSGGEATYAKIVAARELGIPVVMVRRPALPPGEVVPDVAGAILWLIDQLQK